MPDRRQSVNMEHAMIQQTLHEHSEAIKQVMEVNAKQEVQLAVIENKVDDIQKNTQSIVELFHTAEGTTKFIKGFGSLLVWVSGIIAALSGLYYAVMNWPDR